jgi:hypothetical protein
MLRDCGEPMTGPTTNRGAEEGAFFHEEDH